MTEINKILVEMTVDNLHVYSPGAYLVSGKTKLGIWVNAIVPNEINPQVGDKLVITIERK